MRSLWIILVSALLILSSVTTAATADCGERHKGGGEKKISRFICYLVTPWPIRHRCADEDSDMDGVMDSMDKCPGTPKGAVVDEAGCPIDSDGDGVFDGIDKCPGTPKAAKVDMKGCPMDADGDGIADGVDRCPDTPKKVKVDETGCPVDSDRDGVPDGIDRCADTPADLKVDEHGCPIEVSEIQTQLLDTGMIRTTSINFATGQDEIMKESYKVLDEIGAVLAEWPELKIEIGGHTDAQGSETFNQTLSEKRAQAVQNYLVTKFPKIQKGNLTTKGYGEGTPVATNDTAEGRAQNRRVEFTVLNKEELKRQTEQKRYQKK